MMSRGKTLVFLVALCLALPAGAAAQSASGSAPTITRGPGGAVAAKEPQKPVLAPGVRVNTDEAVRSLASEEALRPQEPSLEEKSSEGDVVELHPSAAGKPSSSSSATEPGKPAPQSPRRKIHGSVYGAAGTGGADGDREGAAVGASSKGGKASIYVETNRSRNETAPPR
jgi:hypothetical protein